MDYHAVAEQRRAEPRFVQRDVRAREPVADELARTLAATPSHIDPKLLYDDLGSRLFTAITLLPEYYPTRCEAEIFARHGADIAQAAGEINTIVDLGAGDCSKGEALLQYFDVAQYVPVDISARHMGEAAARIAHARPALDVLALGLDLSGPLDLPVEVIDERRLFVYAGSSIGNLAPAQARELLGELCDACRGGGLLVGVDRVKPREVLEPAYDDALGVTAAFNLNVLRHANHILGADFDVRDWRHVARYEPAGSRMEMHLQARRALTVTWPTGFRRYDAGESIHTENSYKYQPEDFSAMLREAGFDSVAHWTDRRGWFSVFLARA
jgi:probable methyltransferase